MTAVKRRRASLDDYSIREGVRMHLCWRFYRQWSCATGFSNNRLKLNSACSVTKYVVAVIPVLKVQLLSGQFLLRNTSTRSHIFWKSFPLALSRRGSRFLPSPFVTFSLFISVSACLIKARCFVWSILLSRCGRVQAKWHYSRFNGSNLSFSISVFVSSFRLLDLSQHSLTAAFT